MTMSLTGRRIELWVEARAGVAAVNPVMRALLDELVWAGATVRVRVPEHEVVEPLQHFQTVPPDLVLLKSATTLAISLAVADEVHGVTFLNGARASARTHDKAATIARLAAAGLPVPPTFLCGCEGGAPPSHRYTRTPSHPHALTLPHSWIVKPTRGVHGAGVSFHAHVRAAVAAMRGPAVFGHIVTDGTWLLQRRVGGDEADIKVYVAGEAIFAGAKQFRPESYAQDEIAGQALDLPTRDIVQEAGRALGLRCFGLDLRVEDGRPYIIDANPFPGYRGFPGAVSALRMEIERALEARR